MGGLLGGSGAGGGWQRSVGGAEMVGPFLVFLMFHVYTSMMEADEKSLKRWIFWRQGLYLNLSITQGILCKASFSHQGLQHIPG